MTATFQSAMSSTNIEPRVLLALLVAVVIVVWALANTIYNIYVHPLRSVPGPLAGKLSSHYLQIANLKGLRSHTLLALHEKYGSCVRIGPNEVSISDHEMYRKVYTHGASVKEDSFYASTRLTPPHENIFSMRRKAQHAARRKMENHAYSLQSIQTHEPVVKDQAEVLLRRILAEAATSDTRTVDVHPLCGLFSLEVICQVAFDEDIDAESTTPGLNFLKAMSQAALISPLSNAFPFLSRTKISESIPGVVGRAFSQRRQWEDTTRRIYQAFVHKSSHADDDKLHFLASPFVHKVDDFLGRRLTEDEGVEEAMGLAFAGSGTTSTTIVYILYHMSRPENRAMQLKLREELRTSGKTTAEVTELPYLNAVIKEAMRLNPSLMGTLPRVLTTTVAMKHDDVSLVFPPGTLVSMQNYVHHRNPSVYPNPHTFDPDRWIGQAQSSAVEKAFTPYSLGPRNCIGQNLANLELRIATSLLFRSLDFRLNPEMKESDMEMEDRFAALIRGGKLLLDVRPLDSPDKQQAF